MVIMEHRIRAAAIVINDGGCCWSTTAIPDFSFIQEVQFLSPEEMSGLTVFPEALKDELWRDLASGHLGVKYLGQQRGGQSYL